MRRLLAPVILGALLLTGCQSAVEDSAPTITTSPSATPDDDTTTSTPTPTPTPVATGPATQVQQVSPFSSDGQLMGEFTIGTATGSPVVCTDDKGSPNGSTTDTHACGPASLRAQACWKSPVAADNGAALYCLTNPWSTALVKRPATSIPPTTPRVADPLPLGVELGDGSRWAYYAGGGWPAYPEGHTALYECVQGCRRGQALGHVTGQPAVNKSQPAWTMVRLDADGTGPTPVAVRTAWFIASAIKPEAYPTASGTPFPTVPTTPGPVPSTSVATPTPSEASAGSGRTVTVDATVRTTADAEQLSTVGVGFKAFLATEITRLRAGSCSSPVITVARYHSDGFAAGKITTSCGTKRTYWSKASGAWLRVSSSAGAPSCAILEGAQLPTDVVAGTCRADGKEKTYEGSATPSAPPTRKS